MAESTPDESGSSPRSTVGLVAHMTGADVMSAENAETTKKEPSEPEPKTAPEEDSPKEPEGRLSPTTQQPYAMHPPHLTPQPGYYLGYPQSQVTPEPPSPAGPGAVVYDATSFFQQPGAFAPHSSAFGTTPLSPPRNSTSIPPASPLFPRVSARLDPQRGPPSPQLPYMSSPTYAPYPQSGDSPEDGSAGWNERNAASQAVYQNSPQIMSYGMAATRAAAGGRAMSFEETMLPPSALDPQDAINPAYSPYGGSQSSPIPAGGTLFAQQPWGYGGPPDMYSTPGSPLQPRPSAPMGMYGGGGMRGMPYGQYYPASSPGPPIQTTASNKGPDGANLFIFHIPNHFTNLDMYQLFCPYGNLLSVRIMVEKDTGRSRGFGFVSYDAPESAALAIKELNGFAIGNKRLKVQHKQIRPKDMHDRDGGGYGMPGDSNGYAQRSSFSSSLPPSGPMAGQGNTVWYGNSAKPEAESKTDEVTELTSSTSGGETESPLTSLGTLQNALPDVPGNASE